MNSKLFPLTNGQEVMLRLYGVSPIKCMLNIPTSAFFEGDYDEEKFRLSLKTACMRCDSLSIRLRKDGDSFVQYFDHSEPDIKNWDFTNKKDSSSMDNAIQKDSVRDTCAYDAPLYRLYVIKTHDGMIGAYINVFHIVLDSIGICMFWTDMMKIYSALVAGSPIPPEPASFESQIEVYNSYIGSAKYEEDKAYWIDYYNSISEPTFSCLAGKQYLEAFRKKVKMPDIKCAVTLTLNSRSRHDIHIVEPEFVERITEFAKKINVSPYAVFETASVAYLAEVNEIDDVMTAVVSSCRANKVEMESGGSRVNPADIIIHCERGASFAENCRAFMMDYFKELRHSRFPNAEVSKIFNEKFNTPRFHNYSGFFISYQPYRFPVPDGLKLHTMWHCIGHSIVCTYATVMDDDGSGGLRFYYDLPEVNGSKEFIKYVFDSMLSIIDKGMSSDRPLGEIMAELPPVPIDKFKLPALLTI